MVDYDTNLQQRTLGNPGQKLGASGTIDQSCATGQRDLLPLGLERSSLEQFELGLQFLQPLDSLGDDLGQNRSWLMNDLPAPSLPIVPPQPLEYNELGDDPHQLPRRRSRYLIRRAAAQSGPVVIPNASALNPMERWRNSPPEEEPALIPDILNALRVSPKQRGNDGLHEARKNGHAFQHYRRAASTTSGESSASSRDSHQSGCSNSSTQGSLGTARPPGQDARGQNDPQEAGS
ncbi:uncharacterized protein BDV17DRAFT_291879 [Aspergillus undulatus]|uniref:uncharacterized protein n=1 Tax=Aspergillus undulatus TaxID=1810928 RepID=UPI003CCE250E